MGKTFRFNWIGGSPFNFFSKKYCIMRFRTFLKTRHLFDFGQVQTRIYVPHDEECTLYQCWCNWQEMIITNNCWFGISHPLISDALWIDCRLPFTSKFGLNRIMNSNIWLTRFPFELLINSCIEHKQIVFSTDANFEISDLSFFADNSF